MKKVLLLLFSTLITVFVAQAQGDTKLFERLQGISNNGVEFFNIDGVEITSQKKAGAFDAKSVIRQFKALKIKEKELVAPDSLFDFPNFYVFKKLEEPKGTWQNFSYYFIESRDKQLLAITFGYLKPIDKVLERKLVRLIRDEAIPQEVFNSMRARSFNFAGRRIPMTNNCYWMGVNNLQCRYGGQMNWSVHRNSESADMAIESQYSKIVGSKKGKVVLDTLVSVVFEDAEVRARKVTYDFTGVTSLLLKMAGGKVLTIYFVAAPVRNHYVSCVMSFWDSDQINHSGLPSFLEQVIKLKTD